MAVNPKKNAPIKKESAPAQSKFIYFRHKGSPGYPVYVRLVDLELEKYLTPLMKDLFFEKVPNKDLEFIKVNAPQTRILDVSTANPKLAKKLGVTQLAEEALGVESISVVGPQSFYRYRGVAAFLYSPYQMLWEMGLNLSHNAEQDFPLLKIVFCRFLSMALASHGVLGFWAVSVDEGIVVMRPNQSQGEAVFIDVKKGLIFTQDGEKKISGHMQVVRLDSSLKASSKIMRNDELYGFLSTHSTYLSMTGMPQEMRQNFMRLVEISTGILYPEDHFKPRAGLSY